MCHTVIDFSESIIDHIFSKGGCGSKLPGVGSEPQKVIANVFNIFSANTLLVLDINMWLKLSH
jgi:hypothetical protein